MPIPTASRNALLQQLNDAFDAMEAGTLFEQDFIHQSFNFVASGRTYIVAVLPEGNATYAIIKLLLKRKPL